MRRGAGLRHRGFSLIELLVVLGVVTVLAAAVISVGARVYEQSRIAETHTTLQLLNAAVAEWEAASARQLSWWQTGDDPARYPFADVHADTAEVFIISEITDRIGRPASVKAILAQLHGEQMLRYRKGHYPDWVDTPLERSQHDSRFDGSLTVLDAWGVPIYAIHPGRDWRHDYLLPADPDGTLRTYNEEKYGVAPNRRIVFVSAGPDGFFGLDEEFPQIFGPAKQSAKREAQRDNLYSIEVVNP